MDNAVSFPAEAIARALRDGASRAKPGSDVQIGLLRGADALASALHVVHIDRTAKRIVEAVSGRISREMGPRMGTRRNPGAKVVGPSISDLRAATDFAEDAFPPSDLEEDLEV